MVWVVCRFFLTTKLSTRHQQKTATKVLTTGSNAKHCNVADQALADIKLGNKFKILQNTWPTLAIDFSTLEPDIHLYVSLPYVSVAFCSPCMYVFDNQVVRLGRVLGRCQPNQPKTLNSIQSNPIQSNRLSESKRRILRAIHHSLTTIREKENQIKPTSARRIDLFGSPVDPI